MKSYSILLVMTLLLLFSCSKPGNDELSKSEMITPLETPAVKSDELATDTRKLIKEGNMRFRTGNIDETYKLVLNSLEKYKAYISDENKFNYSSQSGYDLTIRVPADNFDKLIEEIMSKVDIKDLENKSTSMNDVTEEYIDVETRLRIKKESEEKLLQLQQNARNIEETLKINEQLTILRSEIESIEGRMKYLNSQVDYSTLRISFYVKIKYSQRFVDEFSDGLRNGWQIFLYVLTGLSYLWVIILALFLARWGYKRLKRNRLN